MAHSRKRLITFMMTDRCNLACRYCYLGGVNTQPHDIDTEFAKAGIDDFFKENAPAIRFFGSGEPTMTLDKIKEIYAYAKGKAGDALFSEIQSNGFFSEETCDWISNHISMTWISSDGCPDIHDFHRPTKQGNKSSKIVAANIKRLASGKCDLGVRATISAMNAYRQKEMIDYWSKLGVKAIFADHMCAPVVSGFNDKPLIDTVDMMEYARLFIEARAYAEQKGVFYSNFLMVNFDEPTTINCRCQLPMPHLTPAGLVTSCDMVCNFTGTAMDGMIYGHWDKDSGLIQYNHDRINKIRQRRVGRLRECESCEAKLFCAGGCAGEAVNETGDFFGVNTKLCDATRYLAKELGVDKDTLFPYIHP